MTGKLTHALSFAVAVIVAFSVISVISAECTYGATEAKLKAPVITSVNDIDDSALKIKWKKVTKANKYYIYRATQKNGTFKKIGTVSSKKNVYTDYTIKNNKAYYYKVKAVASKPKYNSSLSKAKWGKVSFDGKIYLSNDVVTLAPGGTAVINVDVEGWDGEVEYSADYCSENMGCAWEEWWNDDGSITFFIWYNEEITDRTSDYIRIYFGKRPNLCYKEIRVNYTGEKGDYNIAAGVLDFGEEMGVSPEGTWHFGNGQEVMYVYDIKALMMENLGQTPEMICNRYIKLLEENATFVVGGTLSGLRAYISDEGEERPDSLPYKEYETNDGKYSVLFAYDKDDYEGRLVICVLPLTDERF